MAKIESTDKPEDRKSTPTLCEEWRFWANPFHLPFLGIKVGLLLILAGVTVTFDQMLHPLVVQFVTWLGGG